MMTHARRLYDAAHHSPVDRPPCICPGGMMNMVSTEVMELTHCGWPEAHCDPRKMAALAYGVRHNGGFENYGVPFCMTVEAEAFGATVDLGDRTVEPHVIHAHLASARDWPQLEPFDLNHGRPAVVLEAIRMLKAHNDFVPIIGNLTGPISVAGTVVDMTTLLKEFRKQPEACHRLLEVISEGLIAFGQAQVAAGADAICVAEPSGTGEILGAERFSAYALTYINRVLDAISVPSKIVHICGQLRSVYPILNEFHCDAFSFDSVVNVQSVAPYLKGKAIMGNVNTHAIGSMPPEKVHQLTCFARQQGVHILAPACGLPLTTPLKNIQAMTAAAQEKLGESYHA